MLPASPVSCFWGYSLLLHVPRVPFIGHPDGFGQVPKHGWVSEVEGLRDVIPQDPGELCGGRR